MQQLGDPRALLAGEGVVGELDQIAVQQALQLVQRRLVLLEQFQFFAVVAAEQFHGGAVIVSGQGAHMYHRIVGAVQADGGSGEEALVQDGKLVIVVTGHGTLHQPDKNLVEGEKQDGAADIEEGVQGGDVAHIHGGAPKGQAAHCCGGDGLCAVYPAEKDQGADDVEVEVEHGGAPGVLAGADGGNERGDTGADVLAHDNGKGDVKGDNAGGGEGLEDAHRGGGALEQRSDQRAHQNTQKGIGEGHEELPEGGDVLEGGHSHLHGGHADEQQAQTQQELAHNFFLAALEKHIEHNAGQGQQRAEILRLHQRENDIIRGDIAQAEDLSGDGGADIGAHNDAHGLLQLHDAGVDEAHAHDGGGGRAVDQSRHQRAHQNAHENIVGELLHNAFQPSAGEFFQSVRHRRHAEEEGGDCAQKRNHV